MSINLSIVNNLIKIPIINKIQLILITIILLSANFYEKNPWNAHNAIKIRHLNNYF